MAKTNRTFAETLKALRESRGLSQRALAKLCGLSGQAMSLLELGIREPTWGTVQLLSKALGVSCEELQDDKISLPDVAEEDMPKKPGRPRKAEEPAVEEPPAGKPKPRKKKGG